MPDLLLVSVGFVSFFASTVTGVGGALLLVPMIALRRSPAEAVAVMAPVMAVHTGLKLLVFRESLNKRAAWAMLPTALAAAIGAAFLVPYVPADLLRGGIGGLVLLYALTGGRLGPWAITFGLRGLRWMGVLTGVVNGIAATDGPVLAIALLGHGLLGAEFIATGAAVSTLLHTVKLPVYVAGGIFHRDLWILSGWLALSGVAAVIVAQRLVHHIPPRAFRLILRGVLAVVAVYLLVA